MIIFIKNQVKTCKRINVNPQKLIPYWYIACVSYLTQGGKLNPFIVWIKLNVNESYETNLYQRTNSKQMAEKIVISVNNSIWATIALLQSMNLAGWP